MKCGICGAEIENGNIPCPVCGQPARQNTAFASVKKHWEAVGAETKRYEAKRAKAAGDVRDTYRTERSSTRLLKGAALVIVLVFVFAMGLWKQADETVAYMNAWWAMEQGEYQRAYELFDDLDGFLNARENGARCLEEMHRETYQKAETALENGEYEQALILFRELGDYSDASRQAQDCTQRILSGIAAPAYHWSFDEDLSEAGGAETGIRGDAAVKGVVDSVLTPAAFFDGNGDYLTGGSAANITENWAVEALIAPKTGADMVILAKMDWKTGSASYRLVLRGGCVVLEMRTADGETVALTSNTQLTPGEKWYHIVAVKQGRDVTLYLDGTADASLRLTEALAPGEEILTVGDQSYRNDSVTEQGFFGYIADLAIYENALSAMEIELKYTQIAELCCTHWDTSFYALPEEAERDHFVIYRSGDGSRYEALVFNIESQTGNPHLEWNAGQNSIAPDGKVTVLDCARYYLEGEEWLLAEEGIDRFYVTVSELISSTLDVYEGNDLYMEKLAIGGRG